METFIVRPFGKKKAVIRDKNTGKIIEEQELDFDRVEAELIAPALAAVNLEGGTTGKIFEAGDIREDMFSLLLLADIVIADITIHNANVFYELGIRHALRDKKTILIKCPGFDETPFDIIGYRYVSYKKDNPAAKLPDLISALKETLLSDRKDSPVFNVLPMLEAQDPKTLLAVPSDFSEEVKQAASRRQRGRMSLLAAEVEGFSWKVPALRMIGEMVFQMKAFETGRVIWEKINKLYPDDCEANDRLATIYQRLAEKEMDSSPEEGEALLAESDSAIEKLINTTVKKDRNERAEAWSLKGRNEKTRWIRSWKKSPPKDWSISALKSDYLINAFESYEKAYYEDLNHFYSGINALGLLTVIVHLARAFPDMWELLYDTKEDADQKLKEFIEKQQELSTSIKFSIDAEKKRLKEAGKTDPWLNITEADLACLTSKNPARVGIMYKKVLEGVNQFNADATVRQLKLYEQLGVVPENVKEALAALPDAQPSEKEEPVHYLLFTGHMIDKPERKEPRFPAAKEVIFREKIKEQVIKVKNKAGTKLIGIAGGACGGDTLFHEICQELGIPTELYLALPREQFLVESVQFAGPEWVDRFDALYSKLPRHILSETIELPRWLQKKKNYTIWERNNLWELNSALVNGGINMTLLALWDGKGGDGPGGTADMVKEAKKRGSKTIIISI